ncbi:MAG: hypothetical protein OSA99_14095 [Acidimicrobiales bacterium]|nr:hypothetical protein [Acidimicrobiales bacterium]
MLLPHVTVNSGFTYNDSAGLALSLAVLWAGARSLTGGPTTRRIGALATLSAGAALTRVSAVPFAFVAIGLAFAGALRLRRTPGGLRRSMAVVAVPAVVTLLLSGPIYLRNIRLYGDLTGGKALYELLGRHSRPVDGLFEAPFLAARYRGLWVDLSFRADSPPVHFVDRMSFVLLWAGLALGVIAVVLRSIRWWRGEARHELIVVAALLLLVAVVMWGFVQHVTSGGIAHSRYLPPAWPVYALLVAAGLTRLPRRLATAALGIGLCTCIMTTALVSNGVLRAYLIDATTRVEGTVAASWREGLSALGFPLGLVVVLAGLSTLPALAALLSSYLTLRRTERGTPCRLRPLPPAST